MFEFRETGLSGCLEIISMPRRDIRGAFVKTFHADAFEAAGLRADFREQYYSVSGSRVLRGLHFQLPPHDHVKLVYCTEGVVQDVAIDLRRNSPSYGRHVTIELAAEKGNMLYLPSGFAHGFAALTEKTVMVYNVTSVYNALYDAGVRWNSAGISWAISDPLLSDRDAALPPLSEFVSPFRLQDQ